MELKLETAKPESDGQFEGIAIPPQIVTDKYWAARIKVSENQALLLFPKFFTYGIGFEKEEDWNTNLPYTQKAIAIWGHIEHNRLDADKETCLEAIELLQEYAKTIDERVN